MTGSTTGRSYLVTGAASGIGAATCTMLTAAGHRVTGVDRDVAGLNRMLSSATIDASIDLDLTDLAGIRSRLDGAIFDGVANVAGVGPDLGRVDAIFAINLLAPLTILDTLRPGLPRGGAVVNVSSITGEVTDHDRDADLRDPLSEGFLERITGLVSESADAYKYSKRALLIESRVLAIAWAPDIRVNCVSPGITETPMGERSMAFAWTAKAAARLPLGRLGRPGEVAAAIGFLLSDQSSYITGSSLVVDGGYVAAGQVRASQKAQTEGRSSSQR